MFISREELTFDVRGAAFDLTRPNDRKVLGWVFNQFLYGEVTGIQCGYWLYRAPSITAASFLARQAAEEFSHARRFAKILGLLGEPTTPPHFAVKFLATGMMGKSWGEHVFLEMALGEGLVLSVMYFLSETVSSPEIKKILESSIPEEERHVEFGEKETVAWVKAHPSDRSFLLTQAALQVWAMRRIRGYVLKTLSRMVGPDHPVLKQFPQFYDFVLRQYELRIHRLGLTSESVAEMSWFRVLAGVVGLFGQKLFRVLRRSSPLLTETYLQDAALRPAQNGSAPTESELRQG